MINALKRYWVLKVLYPIHRRKMRNGVIAILELNLMMKANNYGRKHRRQVMRDLIKRPENMVWMLDLLYVEHGLEETRY